MKKQNVSLLDLEVTRKEFLIYICSVLLGLFGIDNFLSLLKGRALTAGRDRRGQNVGKEGESGFGTRRFGI
jgi:hypothetical protein